MKHKYKILLVTCAMVSTVISGCIRVRHRIAYTVYPTGYIISRLVTDEYQYQSVQKADAMVQVSELSKNYQKILSDSNVFFHIGNLEPYYAVYQKQIKKTGVEDYDLSSRNAVYQFARYKKVEQEDGTTDYEAYPYYEGEVFETIDMTQKDLSFWNDPISMLSMAGEIKEWLVTNDPDHAKSFNERYETLENELISLDAQYQTFATSAEKENQRIALVCISSNFGCWQKAYGFETYPLMLSRYGILPNEEQIKAMESRILQDDVKYIAYESNMTEEMTALCDRVREDLSLKKITLSNLSSLSESEASEGKDYISIMYENLNTLRTLVN